MLKSLQRLLSHPRRTRKPRRRAPLEVMALEAREVPSTMYDIQWLGTLSATDNFSSAQGINDHGQVVGNSWLQDSSGIPSQEKAFSWTATGGLVDLGTLNGNAAYAWDVNNNGVSTGWYHYPVTAPGTTAGGGYYEWAYIHNNGVSTTIPGLAAIGLHSVAYGVNDNNIVVGSGVQSQAYTFDGATVKFLSTLGGQWAYAMDINNSNVVAGFADTGENPSTQSGVYMSRYHAVIWSPTGVIQDLGTFGTDSYAYKINASGMAVGSSIGSDGFYHPFLWDGTRMIDLGVAGTNGEALSINNLGQIVGDSGNWLNSSAFLYENGTRYDLSTLVNWGTGPSGDSLLRATDINNLGQIVGYGRHNGAFEAFVLTPNGLVTPPPVTPPPPPANAAPTANAGGPYAITIGNSLTLDASLSSDPDNDALTFTWDVNGDGVFGDATGVTPTLTAANLQTLGVVAGNYTVSVHVDDGQGHTVTASTTLTVSPAPSIVHPTASVSGPTDGFQGVTGQDRTLILQASDSASTAFEFSIDWGDGTNEGFYAASGAAVTHAYETDGTFTVTVTATNADSLTSDPVSVTLNIQKAEQQGAVTALGGTAADDAFLLQQGATAGTIATPYGTFATGQLKVFGGKGSDRLVLQGGTGNDVFGINQGAVVMNDIVVEADSVENWTADGGAGNDTFYLNGDGVDITLKGGDGNDRFHVSVHGAVTGRIDGGAGSDILDYALHQRQVTVDLQAKTASDTGGIASIEGFVGGNLADTLRAANTTNTWKMNGDNSGTLNGVQFSSFENWIGGTGHDTFMLANARYLSGILDGGAGSNTLDYTSFTSGVSVDLTAGTATAVRGGIANIANVFGGAGNDTLVGDAGDNILLGNAGNDSLNGGPGGNDVLVGDAGNDSLTAGNGRNLLIGGSGADTLVGGSGDDILIGGSTSYDANVKALQALVAEWGRTDLTYQQRIDHLSGKTKGGLNGSTTLKKTTVKDDGAVDQLSGRDGLDWFWGLVGEAGDRVGGERLS